MNDPRLVFAVIAALIVFFAWGFLTEGWLIRAVGAATFLECPRGFETPGFVSWNRFSPW